MKVRNINGTRGHTCNCGSWLDHWLQFSGEDVLPTFCAEEICLNTPEVGAHVQKARKNDNNWYIVPLCKEHNAKRGEAIAIAPDVRLAPANVSKTCG